MRTIFDDPNFWKHVSKQEDGCWLWTRRVPSGTYEGVYSYKHEGVGISAMSRRYAWHVCESELGLSPLGQNELLQSCVLNFLCVNPYHMSKWPCTQVWPPFRPRDVEPTILRMSRIKKRDFTKRPIPGWDHVRGCLVGAR